MDSTAADAPVQDRAPAAELGREPMSEPWFGAGSKWHSGGQSKAKAPPKGRWMFAPPEPLSTFHEGSLGNYDSTADPTDPTITSFGGPDSEVVSLDSESHSGQWILRPFGSLEVGADLLAQRPHKSEFSLHVEPARSKFVRRKRPAAPKPRLRRSSLIRQESLLVQVRPSHSVSTHRDRDRERDRDAFAISSAIDLAWKEAWDLAPMRPPPSAPPAADAPPPAEPKETAAVASRPTERQSRPRQPRTISRDFRAKGSKMQPPSEGPATFFESELGHRAVSPSKKPTSDRLKLEMKRSDGTPDAETKEETPSEHRAPIVLPLSKKPLTLPTKTFLTADVCPLGVCDVPVGRESATKYCPWHPRSLFRGWAPHKPPIPGLSEEEGKISGAMAKDTCLPYVPQKPKQVDASCCMEDLPSKTSKAKTTKQIAGKKTLRPEIRRWLLGYPENTRFRREMQDLIRNAPPGMSVEIDEDNERHVFVDMQGPDQSLYEGGLFRIEVFFTGEYPHEPPQLRFMTKIYHPNVDKLGRIRLPEIEEKWSPSLLLREVLGCLRRLLANPNVDEPIAIDVARRWYWQESSAQQTARLWTRKFAHRHSAAAWLDCRCACCCEQLAAVSVFV